MGIFLDKRLNGQLEAWRGRKLLGNGRIKESLALSLNNKKTVNPRQGLGNSVRITLLELGPKNCIYVRKWVE
jgi:hypothetical protein